MGLSLSPKFRERERESHKGHASPQGYLRNLTAFGKGSDLFLNP